MTEVRALVTGAASGLGRAIVAELAAGGAQVLGVDLPGPERAAAVEAAGATFVPCDVSDQAAWTDVVAAVTESLGTVTLLALNAGVMTRSPREAIDDDPFALAGTPGYRRVFAVNVDGVVFGLAALRPVLAEGANVLVTASVAGLTPLPFDPYYAMTKHAVVGFVRSVAPLLAAQGVRINAYCPGGIDTAIVPDAFRERLASSAFQTPEVVARALLSVAGRGETGGTWLLGSGDELADRYEVPPVR